MLVQLSPFKTVNTSIKLSEYSRRRKRNESDVSDLPAEASYVTTSSRRGQVKWKQHSEEFMDSQPLLLVSSDHQMSTIGKSKDHEYDEFSSLRYSSRPGNVSSFAPMFSGKISEKLPRIPPILDAKNDQVYAFQHGNCRLCCWNALQANGPDEKKAVRVDLAKPAVSMSLLPLHKGIVYGSCTDGTIFVARHDTNTEGKDELSLEYLPSKLQCKLKYAGTLSELPQGHANGAGRKRKMSDADGRTNVNFFQVFHDDKDLHLVRHEVQFERFSSGGKIIVESSLNRRVVQIPLVMGQDEVLVTARVNSCTSDASKASITYDLQHVQEKSKQSFCALLSLTFGDLTHYRVELPIETLQYGMLSETILATATQETLCLFDLESGCNLHTASMPKDLHGSQDSWLLRTDSKSGAVAILYDRDGLLVCAISSLMLDEQPDTLAKKKLSLASRLASSLLDAQAHACSGGNILMNHVLNLRLSKDLNAEQIVQDTIRQTLKSLEEARMKSVSPSTEDVHDFMFLDTYEGSVATLLSALNNCTLTFDGNEGHHNPQDDLPCNGHGKINGVPKKVAKNGLNGLHSSLPSHTRAITPSSLPQAFLDGATQIVLKLLRAEPTDDQSLARRMALTRLDARVILSRLLHTGKLSARLHFDGTEGIQSSHTEHKLTSALRSVELCNKKGRRYFSPVDMIMTMLQNCPDISERQMVVMLSYMMRRALPEDIAEMFIDERKNHHQNAELARKFFALRSSLFKATGPLDNVQSPELEKFSHRLILSGTSYLLHRLVSYSQCNEPMLRVALQDLIEKHEALILARLLSNMLSSSQRKDAIAKTSRSGDAIKSICQWVAALSDSFHDELTSVSRQDGKTYLSVLLTAVNLTTKHSEEIISLKEDVQRVESEIQARLNAKSAPVSSRVNANQEDLPGYSVETLTF